jgi:hypothetical protein
MSAGILGMTLAAGVVDLASGSLAIFATTRRASSHLSNWSATDFPLHSAKTATVPRQVAW